MSDQCAGHWFLRASGLGEEEYEVSSKNLLMRLRCLFSGFFKLLFFFFKLLKLLIMMKHKYSH